MTVEVVVVSLLVSDCLFTALHEALVVEQNLLLKSLIIYVVIDLS